MQLHGRGYLITLNLFDFKVRICQIVRFFSIFVQYLLVVCQSLLIAHVDQIKTLRDYNVWFGIDLHLILYKIIVKDRCGA